MDLSRLNWRRASIGLAASLLLIIAILFLPWYSLSENPQRIAGPDFNPDAFICDESDFSCTAWETFPILRFLLLLAAAAPLILAWIIVRGHKLTWPPGELTMTAGFAAMVLIGYNGIIDKPGKSVAEIGIGLDYGYWIALLCAVAIAIVGFMRSMESGAKQGRKAPGTV